MTPFPAPWSVAALAGTSVQQKSRRHKSWQYKNFLLSHEQFKKYHACQSKEHKTGIFRPVPPFGAIFSGVQYNALSFGCILGVQRLCCKSMEMLRRKEDIANELFGFTMVYPYYHYFLNHSERRAFIHNRIVASSVALCVVYANLL